MSYEVSILPDAQRTIERSHHRDVLRRRIEQLTDNPRPQQAAPLKESERWRLRVATIG